jgi:hypothetical protein
MADIRTTSVGGLVMDCADPVAVRPQTQAVRKALQTAKDDTAVADLLFLEAWQLAGTAHLASMLRARQIRRANPELSDEMHTEINQSRRMIP